MPLTLRPLPVSPNALLRMRALVSLEIVLTDAAGPTAAELENEAAPESDAIPELSVASTLTEPALSSSSSMSTISAIVLLLMCAEDMDALSANESPPAAAAETVRIAESFSATTSTAVSTSTLLAVSCAWTVLLTKLCAIAPPADAVPMLTDTWPASE